MTTVTKQTVTVNTQVTQASSRPDSRALINNADVDHQQQERPASSAAMIRNIPYADDENPDSRRNSRKNIDVPEQSKTNRILHMLVIVACVFLVIPLYWVMSVVAPAKSGLDCDRLSHYRHPHKEPFMSTLLFTILCYLVALLVVMITEIVMHSCYHDEPQKMHYSLCPRWGAPAWLYFGLKNFVVYIFGVQATQGIVYLIRKMVAIPRPDFWDVCQPEFLTFDGKCPAHEYTYDYVCKNPDESKWQNASRSFPSGHVAYIFFTAAFCTIFLERRCRALKRHHDSVRYLLRTFEFWLFAISFASSAERIHYNSHHPSDIYSGAFFGIIGAVFVALLLTLPPEVYPNSPGRQRTPSPNVGFEKVRHGVESGDTAAF